MFSYVQICIGKNWPKEASSAKYFNRKIASAGATYARFFFHRIAQGNINFIFKSTGQGFFGPIL